MNNLSYNNQPSGYNGSVAVNNGNFYHQPSSSTAGQRTSKPLLGFIFQYDPQQEVYLIYNSERTYGTFGCAHGKNPLAVVGDFVLFEAEPVQSQLYQFNVTKLCRKVDPALENLNQVFVEDNEAMLQTIIVEDMSLIDNKWRSPKKIFNNVDVSYVVQYKNVQIEGSSELFELLPPTASRSMELICWVRCIYNDVINSFEWVLERVCGPRKVVSNRMTMLERYNLPDDRMAEQVEREDDIARLKRAAFAERGENYQPPPDFAAPPAPSQYSQPPSQSPYAQSQSHYSQTQPRYQQPQVQAQPQSQSSQAQYAQPLQPQSHYVHPQPPQTQYAQIPSSRAQYAQPVQSQSQYVQPQPAQNGNWGDGNSSKGSTISNQHPSANHREDEIKKQEIISMFLLTRLVKNRNLTDACSQYDPTLLRMIEAFISDFKKKNTSM